jgi:hypothetical protein
MSGEGLPDEVVGRAMERYAEEARRAPAYVRDWRRGDPADARGRTLWADNAGEPVWLSPSEVRGLGLTGLMRAAIEAREAGPPQESARSRDVRPSTERGVSAVSADEWFGQEDGMDASDEADATEDEARERAEAEARPAFTERSALPDRAPLPTSPRGEADGWRWWVVRDPGGDRLAYDNRPTLDAWGEDQLGATRDLEAGRAPRPVAAARPRLVQGTIPLALVARAAAEAEGPLDGRFLLGAADTGGIRARLGMDVGTTDREVEAALRGYRLAQLRHLPRRGSDVEAWLRERRDEHPRGTPQWDAVDSSLEDYRLRADVGRPLRAPTPEDGPGEQMELAADGIPDYARADGRTRCRADLGAPRGVCGRQYREHPATEFPRDWAARGVGPLVLHELCDGTWVRL